MFVYSFVSALGRHGFQGRDSVVLRETRTVQRLNFLG